MACSILESVLGPPVYGNPHDDDKCVPSRVLGRSVEMMKVRIFP